MPDLSGFDVPRWYVLKEFSAAHALLEASRVVVRRGPADVGRRTAALHLLAEVVEEDVRARKLTPGWFDEHPCGFDFVFVIDRRTDASQQQLDSLYEPDWMYAMGGLPDWARQAPTDRVASCPVAAGSIGSLLTPSPTRKLARFEVRILRLRLHDAASRIRERCGPLAAVYRPAALPVPRGSPPSQAFGVVPLSSGRTVRGPDHTRMTSFPVIRGGAVPAPSLP